MITLTREAVEPLDAINNMHAWPLRALAVSSDAALSAKIFVYHVTPTTLMGDAWECIASVHQLDEIPEDEAVADVDGNYAVPYYRTDTVEFNARSAEHADELWNIIVNDTQDLVNNFKLMDKLSVADTVVIS